jgi:hypothetical protein
VLVPEALAYASIAGVSPVVGLYAAPGALILCARRSASTTTEPPQCLCSSRFRRLGGVFGTRLEHSAAPDDLIHALPAQPGHLGNDARGVTLRMGLQNRGVKLATRVAQPRL